MADDEYISDSFRVYRWTDTTSRLMAALEHRDKASEILLPVLEYDSWSDNDLMLTLLEEHFPGVDHEPVQRIGLLASHVACRVADGLDYQDLIPDPLDLIVMEDKASRLWRKLRRKIMELDMENGVEHEIPELFYPIMEDPEWGHTVNEIADWVLDNWKSTSTNTIRRVLSGFTNAPKRGKAFTWHPDHYQPAMARYFGGPGKGVPPPPKPAE